MCLRGSLKFFDTISYEQICSCHEYNEKKRCPQSLSLNTKKNGFTIGFVKTFRGKLKRRTQRFFCKNCKNSFTHFGQSKRVRTSLDLKKKAVCEYVKSKSSLQEVSERYGISKTSLLNWLKEITYMTKPFKIDSSKCSGIIQLDGKVIKIKGRKKVLFVSIDDKTKQPLSYLLADGENKASAEEFFLLLKRDYPKKIKGIISDFGRGKCFLSTVKKVFPDIPHQVCNVHPRLLGDMLLEICLYPRQKEVSIL